MAAPQASEAGCGFLHQMVACRSILVVDALGQRRRSQVGFCSEDPLVCAEGAVRFATVAAIPLANLVTGGDYFGDQYGNATRVRAD